MSEEGENIPTSEKGDIKPPSSDELIKRQQSQTEKLKGEEIDLSLPTRESFGGMISIFYLKPPNVTKEQLDKIFKIREPLKKATNRELAMIFEELVLPMYMNVVEKPKIEKISLSEQWWGKETPESAEEKVKAVTAEMAQRWWEEISEGKKTFSDLIKENTSESTASKTQTPTEQEPPLST